MILLAEEECETILEVITFLHSVEIFRYSVCDF